MKKDTGLILIPVLLLLANIGYAQNIICMGYEWSHGYSPYKYIHLYIDNSGNGECNYEVNGGENVITYFALDKDYLDSLKYDFAKVDINKRPKVNSLICSDCGITKVFYTSFSDSFGMRIDTIECYGDEIIPIKRKFNHLFNSEAIVFNLKEYSTISGDQSRDKWYMVDDLLAALAQSGLKNIYKSARAIVYLDRMARNKDWQLERRIRAIDCLPRQWHWEYFGLKIMINFPDKMYLYGKPIPSIVMITNISDRKLKLIKDWDRYLKIGGTAGENDHDIRLPWSSLSSQDDVELNPGDTLKITIENFREKAKLTKGIHWIVMSYTNWDYCGGCRVGDSFISITSDPVQIEIY